MPRSSRGTRLAGGIFIVGPVGDPEIAGGRSHCDTDRFRLKEFPHSGDAVPAMEDDSPPESRGKIAQPGSGRIAIFPGVFQSSVGAGFIHQLTDGWNSRLLRTPRTGGRLRTTAVTSGLPRASCRAVAPTPCRPCPTPGRRPIPATPPGATGTLRFSSGLLHSRGPQPRKARRELADRA